MSADNDHIKLLEKFKALEKKTAALEKAETLLKKQSEFFKFGTGVAFTSFLCR